jgi:hypothetical protein
MIRSVGMESFNGLVATLIKALIKMMSVTEKEK